ncbi:hypothetical protein [Methylobacterium sp. C1]|uniref:hypothetical protein n=1 Tax=Methylobacterium sp. C1 TaxID=1479019 RepID=UPI00133127E5|nr:hypothetical protein [Methylobacterium sp. C1]
MVLALLREARQPGAGKTQTRRVLKDEIREAPGMDAVHPKNTIKHPAPYLDSYCSGPRSPLNPRGMSDQWCWWTRDDRQCLPTFRVPFVPGDRLWVKETWCHTGEGVWSVRDSHTALDGRVIYRADDERRDPGIKWFSSLFLPRFRSRLTLLVTDVRVERLQDISREDAVAEGATMRPRAYRGGDGWCMDWSPVGRASRWAADGKTLSEEDICFSDPRSAFGSFINELHDPRWNLKGDGLWGENPWICAVSFSVHARNIDQFAPIAEAAE